MNEVVILLILLVALPPRASYFGCGGFASKERGWRDTTNDG